MINFNQNNPNHIYDIWKHSVMVAKHTSDNIAHKLAGIFHDIGKPLTYTIDDNNIGHFYGHAEKGAEIAVKILTRLNYPNKIKNEVYFLIKNHNDELSSKKYAVAKGIFHMGVDNYLNLVNFKIADNKGKNPKYVNNSHYEKIKKIAEEYLAGNPILTVKDLSITSKDIMNLGYKGKEIGDALTKMAYLVMSGHKNEREAQISYLTKNGIY